MVPADRASRPTAANPIFVFGYPRSGTTLLRALVGQHSSIHLTQGPELILGLHRAGYGPRDSIPGDALEALFKQLRTLSSCRRHFRRIPAHVVKDIVAERRPFAFWELFERLVRPPDLGTSLWGQKAHNNVFFARDIMQRYPHALIVTVFRDCRSIVLSHLKKAGRLEPAAEGGSPASGFVRLRNELAMAAELVVRWDEWMGAACDARAIAPEGTWLDIRYEDLVRDPELALRRVCELAGVAFEARMLDREGRGRDSVLRGDSAEAHRSLAGDLDASRIAPFEHAPKVLDALVEHYAGPRMRQLGYVLRRPSLRDRAVVRRFARRHDDRLFADLRRHRAERDPAALLQSARAA